MAIRKMTPEDIPAVVELHIHSFKQSLNLLAGRRYLHAFFRWFISRNHIALVSEHNHHIDGYLVGAAIGYEKDMNRSLWFYGITGLLANPFRLINKQLLANIIKRIRSATGLTTMQQQPLVSQLGYGISLVGIAVSDKSKGSGNAGELVQTFEQTACKMHADFVRLSVLKDNLRAQQFYTKTGWTRHESPHGLYYYKQISKK
jgi:ribosomal protein S18 acetylase RimI-like enzyme